MLVPLFMPRTRKSMGLPDVAPFAEPFCPSTCIAGSRRLMGTGKTDKAQMWHLLRGSRIFVEAYHSI